jgi:pyridoxine kinase
MAIHDLSGVGKCSLTVALPILSAMGATVAALPTAVLSTHTGGITGYTYRDLTDDIMPAAQHWRALSISFDALYSGWLGSSRQTALVLEIFEMFSKNGALRLVDPVMGDHGRLYGTYTPDRVQGMAELCGHADLITPNLTEARFLLGEPYREGPMSGAEARALCRRLTARLGPRRVAVTGVDTGTGAIGAVAWDAEKDRFSIHEMPLVPGMWHGTGDIFACVLLGALLRGRELDAAAAMAVDFTHACIARTYAQGTDPRFGVDFESGLPTLLEALSSRPAQAKEVTP